MATDDQQKVWCLAMAKMVASATGYFSLNTLHEMTRAPKEELSPLLDALVTEGKIKRSGKGFKVDKR